MAEGGVEKEEVKVKEEKEVKEEVEVEKVDFTKLVFRQQRESR
jgi:hypothetical protein